ncbi:MAG: LemA family protein [Acidobacteriaceae bacterium]
MMRRSLWIASGVAVVVVMAGLLVYGSYISAQYQMEALQTAAHEQWMQLDGALRRWAASTPQVEAAVAPAAKSNPMALDALASARKTLAQARDPEAVAEASRALEEALSAVMAMGMSDAQVKSDAKFEAVRERLRRMDRQIEQDRQRYNDSLRNYDLFVGEFPNGLWAKVAGFEPDRRFFPNF